MLLYIVARLVV